jgi:O-antigen ligase
MAMRALGWAFLFVVVLAPLPLGAARPWSAAVLTILLAACALIWGVARLLDTEAPAVGLRRLSWPISLFSLALFWGLWQTLPAMPADWAHPLWLEAEAVLGLLQPSISLTPMEGRDACARLLAYGITFFLALQLGRDAVFAWRMIKAIAIMGALLAAYALFNVMSGAEMIGWLDKWAYRGQTTATLVNANHYATLAGLGLLCGLAVLARSAGIASQRRHARTTLWAGMAIVIGTALVFTFSRGGMFSVGCAILLLLCLIAWRRQNRRLATLITVLLALTALLVAIFGQTAAQEWSGATAHRLQVYELTLQLIGERPLLGNGLASFNDAFAAVRPVGMVIGWDYAHNTYLELALELGLPAALLLLTAQGLLIRRCLRGVMDRQQDWLIPALGLSASLLIAVHALIDFSVQIPAIAVCWSALLGLGVAQSRSSRTPQ